MKTASRIGAGALGVAALLLGAACSQPPATNNAAPATNSTSNANAGVTTANSNAAAPAATDEMAHVKEIFATKCASCHGQDGKGLPALKKAGIPDFTDAAWHAKESDEELFEVIRDGEGKVMPAWKSVLSEQEMKQLVEYVRTFPKQDAGAAEEGKTPAATNMPRS